MGVDKSTLYEALFELSHAISGHDDMDGLCRSLRGSLKRVLTFDGLALFLHDEQGGTLRMYGFSFSDRFGAADIRHTLPVDGNPAGWVWSSQQPLLIPDLGGETRWPGALEPALAYGLASLLFVPLTTGSRRLGVLALGFLAASEIGPDEVNFVHRVASEFAATIDLYLTRRQYLHERDRLQMLIDLTNALVSKLSPDELFSAVAEQLHRSSATPTASATQHPRDRRASGVGRSGVAESSTWALLMVAERALPEGMSSRRFGGQAAVDSRDAPSVAVRGITGSTQGPDAQAGSDLLPRIGHVVVHSPVFDHRARLVE